MTPPQPSVWIQELTWEEIRDYLTRDDVGLLPIGSTEQHGPAGTLGVDTYVAIGLAEDAAKRAGVLVAPPLWYGESSHHMALPGIISIRGTPCSRSSRTCAGVSPATAAESSC